MATQTDPLRDVLDSRDVPRLARLLVAEPSLATTPMAPWALHPLGANVLGYVAMLRFDHRRLGLPADLPGTGAVAQVLIDAGAPVDGLAGEKETPLITAASYGDAEVAQVLIDAGADVDAVSATDSGGVPGGSALVHAAVFGMTTVLDLLVAAGARVDSLELAAAAGDLTDRRLDGDLQSRLRALVFAADHERLGTIDQLVAAGTPVNEPDARWQRLALHVAAGNGRVAGVRRLLAHGADPNLRDPVHQRTPLEWAEAHDAVATVLRPLTHRTPDR
jgi:ankyrin repeat protein